MDAADRRAALLALIVCGIVAVLVPAAALVLGFAVRMFLLAAGL